MTTQIPWLLHYSLTFPWPFSNSLTFPGYPEKVKTLNKVQGPRGKNVIVGNQRLCSSAYYYYYYQRRTLQNNMFMIMNISPPFIHFLQKNGRQCTNYWLHCNFTCTFDTCSIKDQSINQSRYNNIIILANVIYHHFLSNVTWNCITNPQLQFAHH